MFVSWKITFYRPQRSCGQGYVLLVSVILLTGGGGLPQCMLGYHPPPREQTPPEQTPPPPEQTPPPPGIRSMSGRYASYWNAFLLLRLRLHVPSTSPFFVPWVQYSLMVLFTNNVKKIKDVAHKNAEVDGTCKRSFRSKTVTYGV